MACGLKKQNTQEGGVHLTERTCSPYNPIIKLMVDDCLGVPIYLVSSIDAIIDEEGRTLRQLLEDIQTGASDGTLNILETIEQILNTLTTLNNIYATDSELGLVKTELEESINTVSSNLETLKKYLLAVFNLAQYGTSTGYEYGTYNDVSYPKIVATIKQLLSDINELLKGECPDVELVDNLKDLLLAIANFDESTFTRDKWLELGILPAENGQLKIIYKILDLVNDLGNLGDKVTNLSVIVNGNTTDTNSDEYKNSILGRLEYILEQITQLQENRFAHLEPDIDKLKGSEYPVTSAYFCFDVDSIHKSITAIKKSSKTEYIYIAANTIVGYNEAGSPYDINEDGKVDYMDVQTLANAIGLSNLPANYDVTGEGDINVTDVNRIIEAILTGNFDGTPIYSNQEWSNYIYEITKKPLGYTAPSGTLYSGTFETFFGDAREFIFKKHPVIEGKVYVDINTSQPYRCNISSVGNVTMKKVMDLAALGLLPDEMLYLPINPNPTQDSELVVNNPKGVNYNNQKSYEISISEENFPVNLTAYPYPADTNQLEDGKYYIQTTPSNILKVCTYAADMIGKISMDSPLTGQYQVEYAIANVTTMVDELLTSGNSNLLTTNRDLYNLKEELIVRHREYLGNDPDKAQTCNDIINILQDVLGETNTDRDQDTIRRWANSMTPPSNYLAGQDTRVVYLVSAGQVTSKSLLVYLSLNPAVKEEDIKAQVFDCDNSGAFNIHDLTSMIDCLLSDESKKTYNLNITPISILVKHENGRDKQIISKDALIAEDPHDLTAYLRIKTENRLVRLVGAEPNEEWWRFNASSICPLIPKVTVSYDKVSNLITLYTGPVATGVASMQHEELPSESRERLIYGQMIGSSRVLSESAEPFIFGTWDRNVTLKHQYQEDDYSIKSGTSFILTKSEIDNGTVPQLAENEYSYTSDTTEFSMMSTPELTPLAIQCNNLIQDFVKEMEATNITEVLSKYNFLTGQLLNNPLMLIRSEYEAFDFLYDTSMFKGNTNEFTNSKIYTVSKYIKITFNLSSYTSDLRNLTLGDLEDYFDYEGVLSLTNRRNVVPNKLYNFPKYGVSITFNEVNHDNTTYLRPVITLINTIEFGYSTSNNIIALTPSNFFDIEISGATTIDLRPFFSLPGHEALTLRGTIHSTVSTPSITFLGTDTNGKLVTSDASNPNIEAGELYQYTISGNLFTLR